MTYNKILLIIPFILSNISIYSQELTLEKYSDTTTETGCFNIDKESTKTYLINLKRTEQAYL